MWLLTADRLFDGVSTSIVERHSVVVEGQKIVAVLPPQAHPPARATVMDFGNATIMPGYVDTHSHLVLNGDLDPSAGWAGRTEDRLFARMSHAAEEALQGGVTTVRDLGAPTDTSVRLRACANSTVLVAGAPITTPGGHFAFLGGAALGVPALREAVRERHRKGVDVVKVMGSGGRLSAGPEMLSPQYGTEELSALVDEAHRVGLPVVVHAFSPAAIEQAALAGVDGIEHCFFAVPGGLAPDLRIIDLVAKRGIAVSPTLGLSPGWEVPPGFRAFLDVLDEVVIAMWEHGVRLVAGTDAGALPGKPHDVLPHAIIHLARLGLPNAAALRAATSEAAAACGLVGKKGALVPGADADIIAVTGNPLARIEDAARVKFVMACGRILSPAW